MSEEIIEELAQLNNQISKLRKSIKQLDQKVDKLSKQKESRWKKLKSWLKKKAKKKSLSGRILKRLIHDYRVSWRFFYCLAMRRKGIQNNKIVFISHRGKQYSCNPMYISKYLMENYPEKFEIVWAFNKPEQFKGLKKEGIKVVKKESKKHLKHLMTAKVIVTNVDFFTYLPKVRGQIALDTWHGGGSYKTCGFANAQNLKTLRQKNHFKRLYSRVNLYCSSSKAFTQQTIRESRLFCGEVLEVGMPRNDILVTRNQPEIEAKVRECFALDSETRILLYAPTYRSEAESIDFEELNITAVLCALEQRFGGTWCCLYRAHHLSGSLQIIDETDERKVVSAVDYPDMQELLYAADVLISDYSSCIWDFSLQYKPVFLYCPDLEKYTDSRDFYTPIENWHFILTRSQEELERCICDFDQEEYVRGIKLHHEELGSCESGQATRAICERIFEACFNETEMERSKT